MPCSQDEVPHNQPCRHEYQGHDNGDIGSKVQIGAMVVRSDYSMRGKNARARHCKYADYKSWSRVDDGQQWRVRAATVEICTWAMVSGAVKYYVLVSKVMNILIRVGAIIPTSRERGRPD